MRLGMILVTMLGARVALAQPVPEPTPPVEEPSPPVEEAPPPAAVLFMEGRTLLEAGSAAEACVKFEQSFQLDSTAAGTMLNLGLCNEQVGKLATAIKWFRRAANRATENNLADTESAAREKMTSLATRVGTLKLEVTAPVGRAVTLDGAKVDELDFGRIELDAGAHVLELTAPNAPTVKRDVDMFDGKATTVQLATAVPPRPKRYELVDVGARTRRISYLTGTAGVALIVGSGVIGVLGKRAYDGGETPKDWDSAKNLVRYGGTSMFVAGVGAVAVATVLRLRAPGKERREIVAPVVTRDHLGFAFARSF